MPSRRSPAYGQAMTRSSKRRQRTAAEWTELIDAWEGSGRGAERFARGRDFSASSLYLWRKRLRAGGQRAGLGSTGRGVDFVPVVVDDAAEAESAGQTRWQVETAAGEALTMSGPDAVRGLEVALRWLDREAKR